MELKRTRDILMNLNEYQLLSRKALSKKKRIGSATLISEILGKMCKEVNYMTFTLAFLGNTMTTIKFLYDNFTNISKTEK